MNVAILFDGASASARSADEAILDTVKAVEAALHAAGDATVRIAIAPDARWIGELCEAAPDMAFNLCEAVDGVASLEPPVIAVLELLGIRHTGSSSWTTALCLRKPVVNAALERSGVPVPGFAVVRRGEPPRSAGFPAICKPAAEDASIGIEQRSVVRTEEQLAARSADMLERWDEIVVQRYIDGREVNVAVLGNEVLPIAEIDFRAMPEGLWRIVSYRSKWDDGCDEDLGASPRCPADLSETLVAELRRVALAAWKVVGGCGYGRVDLRIDRDGLPWVLEVNANPDIAPDAGFARMAKVAGLDYCSLVIRIRDLAFAPGRTAATTEQHWALAQQLSGVPALAAPPQLQPAAD